nr:MAG TPA: hypothetical protein [Caudoviricetes sp.]DAO92692.1 MAG TPA: hypothetical protein [Caudoviricetes sp.]
MIGMCWKQTKSMMFISKKNNHAPAPADRTKIRRRNAPKSF